MSRGTPKPLRLWGEALYFLIPLVALAPILPQGRCFFANDLLGQFGAWWSFLRESLSHGSFPLWNPYNFGGQPFAADPQSFVFYPFVYPFLLPPVGWGLTLFWAFHLYVAARGVGRWLEALGASPSARWLGGAVFALSGLFRVELIHPTITASMAWLPWALAYLEVAREKPLPGLARSGIAFSLLFLCGSPQVTLLSFYALLLYALFRLRPYREHLLPLRSPKSLLVLALALLPIWTVLIPQNEFASRCGRTQNDPSYSDFNARGSLSPTSLVFLAWPPAPKDLPLSDEIHSTDRNGENPLQALSGFVGLFALLLALLALFLAPRGIVYSLSAIALFGVLLSLGRYTPFHAAACAFLPGFSLIMMPCRSVFLFTLAASIFAGLGANLLLTRYGESRPWRTPTVLSIILSAIVLSPLLAVGWSFYIAGPKENFDYRENLVLLEDTPRVASPQRAFWTPHFPYQVRYGSERFFLDCPVNAATATSLRCASGYNPLFLFSYERLKGLPLERFARLWSVQYLATVSDLGSPHGFRAETIHPLRLYRLDPDTNAVKFAEHLEIAPNDLAAFERLRDSSFDVERQAVLTAREGLTLPPDGTSKGFTAQLTDEGPDHQAFTLHAPRDGVAVFPDAFYPGWEARLDGKKTPILTAQSALRAVLVPKGEHLLTFTYQPFWWPWVFWLVALWCVAVLAGILSTNLDKPRNP